MTVSASEAEIREAERQVLLTSLDVVYQYLKLINDLSIQRIQLTGKLRSYQAALRPVVAQELPRSVMSQKKMCGEWFPICYTALRAIMSLVLSFHWFATIIYLFLCRHFYRKRQKFSALRIFLLILDMSVISFQATAENITAYTSAIWIAALLSVLVTRWLIYKENQRIDQENEMRRAQAEAQNQAIAAQNQKIIAQNQATEQYNLRICDQIAQVDQQIDQLTREMMETQGAWFPPAYYDLYAVEQFMTEVANFRAYTVQEMVNIFEQSEHWRREESGQQQIMAQMGLVRFGVGQLNASLTQLRSNQSQIIGQIQYGNVLQVQKMFQDQWNVESIKETIRSNTPIIYNTYYSSY